MAKQKRKKSKMKKKPIKQRNPYAVALALRNGSGFHSGKKYNRNLEKRKFKKESEE